MERMSNMDNNTKIIHEFFYVVGFTDFSRYYQLVVDRETEKMLYGDAFYEGVEKCGRFAVNKGNLNEIQEVVDRKYGLVYKVQIAEGKKTDARVKAEGIVYNYLLEIAENFKNSIKED